MAYPTYLKKLAGPGKCSKCGTKLANALRKAHVIEIWGYSLPESDTAIRILLNILRFRSKIQINVHEPCATARTRWSKIFERIEGNENGLHRLSETRRNLRCEHEGRAWRWPNRLIFSGLNDVASDAGRPHLSSR